MVRSNQRERKKRRKGREKKREQEREREKEKKKNNILHPSRYILQTSEIFGWTTTRGHASSQSHPYPTHLFIVSISLHFAWKSPNSLSTLHCLEIRPK